MKKCIAALSVLFLSVILSSDVSAAETQKTLSFKQLQALSIVVEEIEPVLGITKEAISNIVYARLKAKLPDLQIKKNLHSYLYVRIATLDVNKRQVVGHVSVALKRKLYLPDMKSHIAGGVREYAKIFYVGKDSTKKHIRSTIDGLLDLFIKDYVYAKKYYSGQLKKKSSGHSGKPPGQNQKKGIWTN